MNKINTLTEPKGLFYMFMIFGVAAELTCLLVTRGKCMDVFTYGENQFGDFWEPVLHLLSDDAVYNGNFHFIYPPLCYMFLMIFCNFIGYEYDNVPNIVTSGYGMLTASMFIAVFIVLFSYGIEIYYRKSKTGERLLLEILLICSCPF